MLDGITGKTLSTPLPIIMVGPSEANGSTEQVTTVEEGEGPNSADKASLSNPLFFHGGTSSFAPLSVRLWYRKKTGLVAREIVGKEKEGEVNYIMNSLRAAYKDSDNLLKVYHNWGFILYRGISK